MNTAVLENNPTAEQGTRVYTYQELVGEMPETTQPHELWDGKLIMSPTPSFHHQAIVFNLQRALYDWVVPRGLGKVVAFPIDMVLSPHQAVQPDVVFISKDRLHIIERVIMGAADLVAEVISLGGRQRDRIEKRDLYEQHGVKEYWIVDPEAQTVEVLVLENGVYSLHMRRGRGQMAHSKLLPGFGIALDPLFVS